MFDVAFNKVNVISDNESVINRCRLLILTEPKELYNDINFGVGLKRHLWQYNTDNQKAIILDRIINQLRVYEPCVDADKTASASGLLFTGDNSDTPLHQDHNKLKMTIGLKTMFGDILEVDLNADN